MYRVAMMNALAAVVLALLACTAAAKSLPCMKDEVIKVLDVPHDKSEILARHWGYNTRHIKPGFGLDLGYRFAHCARAGWVGYIGHRQAYFNLSHDQLMQLVGLAGQDALPPEPREWQNPQVRGLAVGLVFVLLFVVVRASGWMPVGLANRGN
jgi:hypothetical protein